MFWPIFIYLIASVAIAGSAAFNVGWKVGLFAITTSVLSLIAGAGLKASLWWGDKIQKIGGPIVAFLLVLVAQWLARGFSAHVFGNLVSGGLWGWVGFAICFAFTGRKLAGVTDVDRNANSAGQAREKNVRLRWIIRIAAGLVALVIMIFYVLSPAYEKLYLARLDDWAKRGAPVAEVNTTVVPSCGKLVLATAGFGETPGLLLWNRAEFAFRVDVCVKAAVNKTYPQPEFKNKKIIQTLCSSDNRTLNVITQHFGICQRP